MLKLMREFVRDEEGLEMVEWAVTAALIITAAAISISSLSTTVAAKFADMETLVSTLP